MVTLSIGDCGLPISRQSHGWFASWIQTTFGNRKSAMEDKKVHLEERVKMVNGFSATTAS
jgi:hypothetical protein